MYITLQKTSCQEKLVLNKKVCTWACHLKNILHSSAVKMQNPEIIKLQQMVQPNEQ